MVRRRQDHASNMFSSATSSSGFSQMFTPQSGSDRGTVAESTNEVDVEADHPLPSIETDDSRRQPYPNRHIRTPSFSISSSGGANSILTPSSTTEHSARTSRDAAIERLGGTLQDLTLSTQSAGTVMTPRGTDRSHISSQSPPVHRGASLHPDSNRGTPSRQSPGRRRRSGSQINHPTHDVAEEQPPPLPFHQPAFQAALANARAQIGSLQQILGSSSLHTDPSSSIHNLYRRAAQMSDFSPPSQRRVALIGDSGVGKSSLINSLLDVQNLARTSSSGTACTCVVTEFHHHARDDFVIEVQYFGRAEFQDQLSELLQAYRLYEHCIATGQELEPGVKEKHDLAYDTFHAAFRSELRGNEQFLVDWSEEDVLQRFLAWTMEVCPAMMQNSNVRSQRNTTANAEECSRRLMQLTSELGQAGESAVWPFIRKIRVEVNAVILSKGLILVDLPGLRDLNSARVKITELYLRECDEIFAVCNIGRATSDVGVSEVLKLAQRARLTNVGIVCTKSDDIIAEEAARDWEPEAAVEINHFSERLAENHQEIVELNDDIEDAINENADTNKRLQLTTLLIERQKLSKVIDCELRSFLMETRNRKVTDSLHKQYQDTVPNSNLKVFCVSNTRYWKYRLSPLEVAQPVLALSGIIEVRKHCVSIVAQSQFRAANHFMRVEIPALLRSIEMWVRSGAGDITTERRLAIREVVNAIEAGFQTLAAPASRSNTLARAMKLDFEQQILQPMTNQSSQWSVAASAAVSNWHGWSPPSYSAFCRKYGNHTTNAVGYHDWNEEAIIAMITSMEMPWERLLDMQESSKDESFTEIENWFQNAKATATDMRIPVDIQRTLIDTLPNHEDQLLSDLGQLYNELEQDLKSLWTDGFSGIRTSIIGQLADASYRASIKECGGGSDQRRKAIIRSFFAGPDIFRSIRRELKSRFFDIARDYQRKILAAIRSRLSSIQEDLDTLKNGNAVLEADQHPEFRSHVEARVAQVNQEMERITQNIMDIEQ